MLHGSGKWTNNSNSTYIITVVPDKSTLSKYYISEKEYDGTFGKKDVIKLSKEGKDRFYVMALEDLNPGNTYTWWSKKYESLPSSNNEPSSGTGAVLEIGYGRNIATTGKAKTANMITTWNADTENQSNRDLWKVIQNNSNVDLSKWFVPNRAEWSAFGDFCYTKLDPVMTNGNSGNYKSTYGLSDFYWSSSQKSNIDAWVTSFDNGWMVGNSVSNWTRKCRLSATF